MALILLLRHRRSTLFLLAAALIVLLILSSAIATRHAPIKFPTRRRLGGPGSSPPTCRLKCGSCSPCSAVHVPIQPGVSLPLEYYPEAWRCKCGNSIYMP